MKTFSLLLTCLALLTGSSKIQAESPASTAESNRTPSQADIDHDAVWAIHKEEPPRPNLMKENPREYFRWMGEKFRRFAEAGQTFANKYPQDARRWEAIVQASYTRPLFITDFKPDFDQHPSWNGIIEDESKVAAFKADQAKRFAALQASTDATPRQCSGAYGALITEAMARFSKESTPENKATYMGLVNEFIAKVPSGAGMMAKQHLNFLKSNGTPDELAAFTAKLAAVDDPEIKQLVAEARGDFSRFNGVADLKFTAADGREVDLTKLRGKVVLVDFWATWCGPCKAEIPNVVANYEKYHTKGFEVIGVTLENTGAKPGDTATQAATKLDTAKEKMLAFTAANKMAWPQYFDGKWWKNDLSTRFGINAIPAMVLLDQSGKVISIEARGPELEAELKRLLRL